MNIKIAIIGSGFGLYGLLPAFNQVKGCKIISICGKNSERMQSNCKKLNLKQYSDWKKMLKIEKPNAIAIAVTPKQQYDIAKYALENNMGVFAEKPLTTSLKTSKELMVLAKERELPNTIDFLFPGITEWCLAKKIIDNKTIGKIIKIDVDWTFLSYDIRNQIKSWKTDVKQGGGALSFYFSHVFYYLEYFLGRIKNLQCHLATSEKSLNGGETEIDMNILFENGCIGKAHMNISCPNKQIHRIEFQGENGSLVLENTSNNFVDNFKLKLKTSDVVKEIKSENELFSQKLDPRVKLVKPIAERFIDWCQSGISTKPDFQDGVRIQELIELARGSK